MDDCLGVLFLLLMLFGMIVFVIIFFWQYILLAIVLGLGIFIIAKYHKEMGSGILFATEKVKEFSATGLGFLAFKYRDYQQGDNQPFSVFSADTEETNMAEEWKNADNGLENWNEKDISVKLVSLQDRPRMFRGYIDSLEQRFIYNQNAKIAKSRINFLEQQIKLLQLANQYGDLQNDLAIKNKEFELRELEVKNKKQDLQLARKNEVAEINIKRLEDERRRLEEEVKIARLKKELEEINNPPKVDELPEKAKTKAEIGELETKRLILIGEKTEKMRLAYDEDHRLSIENEYNNQIEEVNKKIAELKRKL